MSKIQLFLGDTVTYYDRIVDARTGVPLDLSAFAGGDTLQILIVNKLDSTKTTTKTPALETLTGTAKFTNGSATVTGTGTKFYNEIEAGDWVRLAADTAANAWAAVKTVDSDLQLTLAANYAGTGSASAGTWSVRGKLQVSLTATDFTFASVQVPGEYLAQTYINIGAVPVYGTINTIVVKDRLAHYVAP